MGLIQAIKGAAGSVLADQWKEYFYCDSLDENVIMTRGQKRVSGKSSNVNGADNIISNGSVINVADGQCMIIVENGKVAEICAEPGDFTYDSSTEPSIFSGQLSETIPEIFKNIGKRFTFGGDAGKDQRVYYFNTKELIGNKYGTASPVPFRVVDERAGIDMDIAIKCFGEYSYKVTNPILFYTNICGNQAEEYRREKLDGQLKSELLTKLQPAFARISEMGIRYSSIVGHTDEIAKILKELLSEQWSEYRGIEIVSFGVSSLKANEEDEATIKEMQREAAYMDPTRGAAATVRAQNQAMQAAASNSAGAMTGFMGMGMAMNQGGMNAGNLYAMGQQQQAQQAAAAPAAAAPAAGWTCSCGTVNTGKFCSNCGTPQPAPAVAWKCECGAENTGKFCSNCGKPAPAGPWKCECGAENTGKFCSNCGKPNPNA